MREFAEFLGSHAPYDHLDNADLTALAACVEVEFFGPGDIVVAADGPVLEYVFVIRTGSVEILDRGRTVDVLGPGDTFGHISVLSGLPPALAARAAEETLCYRLPDPRTLVAHPERLRYSHYGGFVTRERLLAGGGSFTQLDRPIGDVLNPINWCEAGDSVRTVARAMTEECQSCAVFVHDGEIGIVTDDDFRRRVATGDVSVDAPIEAIASIPAVSVSSDTTVSAAYIEMVEKGIHHLVVVDGTGRPIGIARVVDITSTDVRHPLVVRQAITSATNLDDLARAAALLRPTVVELWDVGVPADHLGAVLASEIDAIFTKLVAFHENDWPFTELDCCWMMMGSIGRREPLPNSDVDTALIWSPRPGSATDLNREQVAAATDAIVDSLTAVGLQPCPQGLNASYPLFNRSAQDWATAAAHWRTNPHDADYLLLGSTIADARPLTHPSFAEPMRRALTTGVGRDAYTRAMLHFALSVKPPTGFVRGFVVEHFGDRKQHLNVKKAALRPVAALASALSIRIGDTSGSTRTRLDRARRCGLLSSDEAETLQSAFALCYQLVMDEQVEAIKAGETIPARISPDRLDSLQRRHLRDAFRAIARVQSRLGTDRFLAGP